VDKVFFHGCGLMGSFSSVNLTASEFAMLILFDVTRNVTRLQFSLMPQQDRKQRER
jgi:hypothetical protein